MADKLSESTWSGFTKKHKLELDDKALLKALAKFDKSDAAKPEPRLDALKELVEQLKKQIVALAKLKKALGDKPFALAKDQLNELLDLAEDEQKKAQAAAADDDDEEPDTPVLLTTKMVPLLRELRKGKVQMHALICTAGKNMAVLIMRRRIAPTRRKLLAQAVDATGGMKYYPADCLFEDKMLTFVVKTQVARMAKRLRQALLDQTELRFKVRVRGEDGAEETDGEDEDDAVDAEVQGAPITPASTAASAATKGAPPPGGPASAEQTAFVQRLRPLRERYEQALRDQHPEATKLRALMGFASEKAAAKDFAAAMQALKTLEKVLAAPDPRDGAQAPPHDAEAAADLRAFEQRLKRVLTRAKTKAAELGAAAVKQLAQQAAAAQAAAKAGDSGRADEGLAAIEAALDAAAAPDGESAASTPGEQATEQAAEQVHRIRQRLAAVQSQVDAVQNAGGRSGTELRALRRMLERQLDAGGVERAALLLERIERLLAEAEQEDQQLRGRLKALADDLAHAEQAVAQQVAALEKALKASQDEELSLIGAAGLGWMLGEHGARLKTLLAQLLKAEAAARSKAADRALQGVGAYLDHLESSPEIAACDGNDLGVAVSIRASLSFALEPMGAALAAL